MRDTPSVIIANHVFSREREKASERLTERERKKDVCHRGMQGRGQEGSCGDCW